MDTNTANPISLYLSVFRCVRNAHGAMSQLWLSQCPIRETRESVTGNNRTLCICNLTPSLYSLHRTHVHTNSIVFHTQIHCVASLLETISRHWLLSESVCVTRTIYANLLAFEYFIHLKETDTHTHNNNRMDWQWWRCANSHMHNMHTCSLIVGGDWLGNRNA